MFTQNYYNLYNFLYKNFTMINNEFSALYTNELVVTLVNNEQRWLNPATNSRDYAYNRFNYHMANPYRDSYLHIGHASTEAEFNDLSEHGVTGVSVVNQGRAYNLAGTTDKMNHEHMNYMTVKNNNTNEIAFNKLMLGGYFYNCWSNGFNTLVTSQQNILIPLITERFDPIVMAPNEVRKFTFKIKYPMYY